MVSSVGKCIMNDKDCSFVPCMSSITCFKRKRFANRTSTTFVTPWVQTRRWILTKAFSASGITTWMCLRWLCRPKTTSSFGLIKESKYWFAFQSPQMWGPRLECCFFCHNLCHVVQLHNNTVYCCNIYVLALKVMISQLYL